MLCTFEFSPEMLIVVMGVCGCGKSTIGKELASKMNGKCVFVEGDNFHPPENIRKMEQGIPLQDHDRLPWLNKLNEICRKELLLNDNVVLSCSALKKYYRDLLSASIGETVFVHLAGSIETISERLKSRNGHFMPLSLFKSQFDTLEDPLSDNTAHYRVLQVDVDQPTETIVQTILASLSQ